MESIKEILSSKKSFPCKLNDYEAGILLNEFKFQKESLNCQAELRTIDYIYKYENEDGVYILLEEYMFLDYEDDIDISNTIGKNYYLNKRY